SGQLMGGGNVRLSFVGIAGTNYALDRSFSLAPADWVPQLTNPAGTEGVLVFTNTPGQALTIFGASAPCPSYRWKMIGQKGQHLKTEGTHEGRPMENR